MFLDPCLIVSLGEIELDLCAALSERNKYIV